MKNYLIIAVLFFLAGATSMYFYLNKPTDVDFSKFDKATSKDSLELVNLKIESKRDHDSCLQIITKLQISNSILAQKRISNDKFYTHEKSVYNMFSAIKQDSVLSNLLRQLAEEYGNKRNR